MADGSKVSGVYSFLDVQASISGPGGSGALSASIADKGMAPEGIKVAKTTDKNTMVIGAGGSGMHSLHATKAGRVTINALKTGPINTLLNGMYRFQSQSSAYWGQNQITINNPVTGDNVTCINGAFVKEPDFTNATEGGMNLWEMDFQWIDEILGNKYQQVSG